MPGFGVPSWLTYDKHEQSGIGIRILIGIGRLMNSEKSGIPGIGTLITVDRFPQGVTTGPMGMSTVGMSEPDKHLGGCDARRA